MILGKNTHHLTCQPSLVLEYFAFQKVFLFLPQITGGLRELTSWVHLQWWLQSHTAPWLSRACCQTIWVRIPAPALSCEIYQETPMPQFPIL